LKRSAAAAAQAAHWFAPCARSLQGCPIRTGRPARGVRRQQPAGPAGDQVRDYVGDRAARRGVLGPPVTGASHAVDLARLSAATPSTWRKRTRTPSRPSSAARRSACGGARGSRRPSFSTAWARSAVPSRTCPSATRTRASAGTEQGLVRCGRGCRPIPASRRPLDCSWNLWCSQSYPDCLAWSEISTNVDINLVTA
jgi:hypothetical protein